MPYVKIIGDDKKYMEDISPFTTQHGHAAVRFIGDPIPETDKGFVLYADDDTVITDLSAYKYIYRDNEYSVEKDIIVPPGPNNEPLPPTQFDNLSKRVSQVNSKTNKNASGINENSNGILDLADLSDENNSAIEDVAGLADENSTAIEDLAALIGDLEERVAALEAKEE